MDGGRGDEAAIADVRDAIRRSVDALASAGARDEALATYVAPRRVLKVIPKSAALVPVGRVWRLGVFLLDADGTLYATGLTTRAVEPGRAGYQSSSAEMRREYRAAAFRGPFARGETVNFDAQAIDLTPEGLRSSTGLLFLRGGQPLVRWSATAGDDAAVPFAAYLAERAELLSHPPEGA